MLIGAQATIVSGSPGDLDAFAGDADLFDRLAAPYVVRVYVYAGLSLRPRSAWIGPADRLLPYCVVRNGSDRDHVVNDRASAEVAGAGDDDDLNPSVCRVFQFDSRFPENARLQVALWHRDALGADSLIGATVVDVEQRLANPAWRGLKAAQRRERRLLAGVGASDLPQGKVDMRVDVLDWQEAQDAPAEVLTRPEPEPYELRLVVWATRDVRRPTGDDDAGRLDEIDQYVTATANFGGVGDVVKSTDTAWGAGASADFNYRLVYRLALPCKVPRVKLTVWDADLFGRSAIGDVLVNLGPSFGEALRDQRRQVHVGAQWLPIEHPDAPGKALGEVNVELWALAREQADAAPVGEAQNAPNRDPYLAPPARKPPPWAVGSRLLNGLDLFAKRKALLMTVCFLVVVLPLLVPMVLGRIA